MHLFLEGVPGSGKTTLIINTLGRLRYKAGGFIVRRVFDGAGTLRGYKITDPGYSDSPDLVSGEQEGLFLKNLGGRWERDDALFCRSLMEKTEDLDIPFLIMDETGGYELNFHEFYRRFMLLLQGDIPIVGVIKTRENYEAMTAALKNGPRGRNLNAQLRRSMAFMDNVTLINVNDCGFKEAEEQIRAFIRINKLE